VAGDDWDDGRIERSHPNLIGGPKRNTNNTAVGIRAVSETEKARLISCHQLREIEQTITLRF
jgi:hypothetical protein